MCKVGPGLSSSDVYSGTKLGAMARTAELMDPGAAFRRHTPFDRDGSLTDRFLHLGD